MKKSIVFPIALIALAVVSCSKTELVTDNSESNAITFANLLPVSTTKTSVSATTGFPAGSTIAVNAFQTTVSGELVEIDKVMNGQAITRGTDGKWTYSPLKYWNIGSTYEFYGIYPSTASYTFDDTTRLYSLSSYTVPNATASQTDLMISQLNTTYPFNLVTLTFNHILSQVNFYFQTAAKYDMAANNITKVEVVSLELTGIKNTGSYAQTGYSTSMSNFGTVEGAWTIDPASGEYDFPEVTSGTLTAQGQKIDLSTDLLMIPQNLKGVKLTLSYRISFNDGSTMFISKELPLNTVMGKMASETKSDYIREWKSNYIYNYRLALNPAGKSKGARIDWDGTEGGGDEVVDPKAEITGPDENGDLFLVIDTDGDGEPDITYPIVWEDLDGDGKLEGGVDRDGDGKIDNVDEENKDTKHDGIVTDENPNNPLGKDCILIYDPETDTWNQLEKDGTGKIIDDDPEDYGTIDWNGTEGGDEVVIPNSTLYKDENYDFWVLVDTDGDGNVDETYPVVWEDLDGDGKLEGGVDRDGDGKIDNVDGENTDTKQDGIVTDGNTNNPNGRDGILVYDNETGTWHQLEKDGTGKITKFYESDYDILFSATVEDWSGKYEAESSL